VFVILEELRVGKGELAYVEGADEEDADQYRFVLAWQLYFE